MREVAVTLLFNVFLFKLTLAAVLDLQALTKRVPITDGYVINNQSLIELGTLDESPARSGFLWSSYGTSTSALVAQDHTLSRIVLNRFTDYSTAGFAWTNWPVNRNATTGAFRLEILLEVSGNASFGLFLADYPSISRNINDGLTSYGVKCDNFLGLAFYISPKTRTIIVLYTRNHVVNVICPQNQASINSLTIGRTVVSVPLKGSVAVILESVNDLLKMAFFVGKTVANLTANLPGLASFILNQQAYIGIGLNNAQGSAKGSITISRFRYFGLSLSQCLNIFHSPTPAISFRRVLNPIHELTVQFACPANMAPSNVAASPHTLVCAEPAAVVEPCFAQYPKCQHGGESVSIDRSFSKCYCLAGYVGFSCNGSTAQIPELYDEQVLIGLWRFNVENVFNSQDGSFVFDSSAGEGHLRVNYPLYQADSETEYSGLGILDEISDGDFAFTTFDLQRGDSEVLNFEQSFTIGLILKLGEAYTQRALMSEIDPIFTAIFSLSSHNGSSILIGMDKFANVVARVTKVGKTSQLISTTYCPLTDFEANVNVLTLRYSVLTGMIELVSGNTKCSSMNASYLGYEKGSTKRTRPKALLRTANSAVLKVGGAKTGAILYNCLAILAYFTEDPSEMIMKLCGLPVKPFNGIRLEPTSTMGWELRYHANLGPYGFRLVDYSMNSVGAILRNEPIEVESSKWRMEIAFKWGVNVGGGFGLFLVKNDTIADSSCLDLDKCVRGIVPNSVNGLEVFVVPSARKIVAKLALETAASGSVLVEDTPSRGECQIPPRGMDTLLLEADGDFLSLWISFASESFYDSPCFVKLKFAGFTRMMFGLLGYKPMLMIGAINKEFVNVSGPQAIDIKWLKLEYLPSNDSLRELLIAPKDEESTEPKTSEVLPAPEPTTEPTATSTTSPAISSLQTTLTMLAIRSTSASTTLKNRSKITLSSLFKAAKIELPNTTSSAIESYSFLESSIRNTVAKIYGKAGYLLSEDQIELGMIGLSDEGLSAPINVSLTIEDSFLALNRLKTLIGIVIAQLKAERAFESVENPIIESIKLLEPDKINTQSIETSTMHGSSNPLYNRMTLTIIASVSSVVGVFLIVSSFLLAWFLKGRGRRFNQQFRCMFACPHINPCCRRPSDETC